MSKNVTDQIKSYTVNSGIALETMPYKRKNDDMLSIVTRDKSVGSTAMGLLSSPRDYGSRNKYNMSELKRRLANGHHEDIFQVASDIEYSDTEWGCNGLDVEFYQGSNFSSIEVFERWLKTEGVRTYNWGDSKTKDVEKLFKELHRNKSVLVIDREAKCVRRYVRIIRLNVQQSNKNSRTRYLIEASQEIGETGQIQFRNMLMSTVIENEEALHAAARRCASKELQNIGNSDGQRAAWDVKPNQVVIPNRRDINVSIEDVDSFSYPGLNTRYVIFTTTVKLSRRLPDNNFCTIEYLPDGHIAKKHHWKWRSKPEIEAILKDYSLGMRSSDSKEISVFNQSSQLPGDDSAMIVHDLHERDFVTVQDTITISRTFLEHKLKGWRYREDEIVKLLEGCGSVISRDAFEADLLPKIEASTLVVDGKIPMNDDQLSVLKSLYNGCCRIRAKILHGGFSGSLVLQVHSSAPTGDFDPTVVKLDLRERMYDELQRYFTIAKYMGDCAPGVLAAQVDMPSENKYGGMKFELVGAVWFHPDFRKDSWESPNLLNTFKTLFISELKAHAAVLMKHANGTLGRIKIEGSDQDTADVEIKEEERDRSVEVFGEVRKVLKETFAEILRKMTLSTCHPTSINILEYYRIKHYVDREIFRTSGQGKHQPDLKDLDPQGESISVFHDFVQTMDKHNLWTQSDIYIHGLVHGDLNGMNILIDSQEIVWLIDFAFAGMGHCLKDLIKLESCILYEYTKISSDEELMILKCMVESILDVDNLRIMPTFEYDSLEKRHPHLTFVWQTLTQIREYLSHYVAEDPEPVQVWISMLHFALRALSFQDIVEKRLPLFVATECARKITQVVQRTSRLNGRPAMKFFRRVSITDHVNRETQMNEYLGGEQLEYEKRRYVHDMFVKESFVIDMITRDRVNITEQNIEIESLEGQVREQILEQRIDVDELQARKEIQRQLEIVQETVHSLAGPVTPARTRFTSPLQVFGSLSTPSHRVILGGAASGKSCLMKRLLLSSLEEQTGHPDDVVPLLILLIDLGRLMTKEHLTSADDLIDRYIEQVYGQGSARLAMFRQIRSNGKLLVLLDGMDEAGDHRAEIEQYIVNIVGTQSRIIISTRQTGFSHKTFSGFSFYQVMPLNEKIQVQVVENRLGRFHPKINFVRKEIRKPQYAALCRNPLMLSLLISILAKNSDATETNRYTRSFLYKHAVSQLLHLSTIAKFGMRRGEDDKAIEHMAKILGSRMCNNYLRHIGYVAHVQRVRDISPVMLADVVEGHSVDPCYFSADAEGVTEALFEVISILQKSVFGGRCSLLAISKVVSDTKDGAGNEAYVMRFVHLSFQEYLAGMYCNDHLERALGLDVQEGGAAANSSSTEIDWTDPSCYQNLRETIRQLRLSFNRKESGGLLDDNWWRGVLLSMAGSMSTDLFEAFVGVLVNDPVESNLDLIADMVNELPEPPEDFKNRVESMIRNRYDESTTNEEVFEALTHTSPNIQYICLSRIRRFSDPIRIAFALAFDDDYFETESASQRARVMNRQCAIHALPWYKRAAAARAFGMLGEIKSEEPVLSILVALWGDTNVVVQREAIDAIKAIGAENETVVVNRMLSKLHDEIEQENGIELVIGLEVVHKHVVDALVQIACLSGSDLFSKRAVEALQKLNYSNPKLLNSMCEIIANSESNKYRRMCLDVLVDRGFSNNDKLADAVQAWLHDSERSSVLAACTAISDMKWKCGIITKDLRILLERHQNDIDICIAAFLAMTVEEESALLTPEYIFQSALKLWDLSTVDQLPTIFRGMEDYVRRCVCLPAIASELKSEFIQRLLSLLEQEHFRVIDIRLNGMKLLSAVDGKLFVEVVEKLILKNDAPVTSYAMKCIRMVFRSMTSPDRIVHLVRIIEHVLKVDSGNQDISEISIEGAIVVSLLVSHVLEDADMIHLQNSTWSVDVFAGMYMDILRSHLDSAVHGNTNQRTVTATLLRQFLVMNFPWPGSPGMLQMMFSNYEAIYNTENANLFEIRSLVAMIIHERLNERDAIGFEWEAVFPTLPESSQMLIFRFITKEYLLKLQPALFAIMKEPDTHMAFRSNILQAWKDHDMLRSPDVENMIMSCIGGENIPLRTVITELVSQSGICSYAILLKLAVVYAILYDETHGTIWLEPLAPEKSVHRTIRKLRLSILAYIHRQKRGKVGSLFEAVHKSKQLNIRFLKAFADLIDRVSLKFTPAEVLEMLSIPTQERFVMLRLLPSQHHLVGNVEIVEKLWEILNQSEIRSVTWNSLLHTISMTYHNSLQNATQIERFLDHPSNEVKLVGLECASKDILLHNTHLIDILRTFIFDVENSDVAEKSVVILVEVYNVRQSSGVPADGVDILSALVDIFVELCSCILSLSHSMDWSEFLPILQRMNRWPTEVGLAIYNHACTAPGDFASVAFRMLAMNSGAFASATWETMLSMECGGQHESMALVSWLGIVDGFLQRSAERDTRDKLTQKIVDSVEHGFSSLHEDSSIEWTLKFLIKYRIVVDSAIFVPTLEQDRPERIFEMIFSYFELCPNLKLDAHVLERVTSFIFKKYSTHEHSCELAVSCGTIFNRYKIKDDAEAKIFLESMRQKHSQPFVFDPLLGYFRNRRASNPNPINGWRISVELKNLIEGLARSDKCVEIQFLRKEMRENFEHQSLSMTDTSSIVVSDHATIGTRRQEKHEQRMMEAEDWHVMRTQWFPEHPLDQKLAFVSVLPGFEYQRSALTTHYARYFVSNASIPDCRILLEEIFPEINMRLFEMGIQVTLIPVIGNIFVHSDVSMLDNALSYGRLQSTMSDNANSDSWIDAYKPFCMCFLGARSGTRQYANSVKEQELIFARKSMMPNHNIAIANLVEGMSSLTVEHSSIQSISREVIEMMKHAKTEANLNWASLSNFGVEEEDVYYSMDQEISMLGKLPYVHVINGDASRSLGDLRESLIYQICSVVVDQFPRQDFLQLKHQHAGGVMRRMSLSSSRTSSTVDLIDDVAFDLEDERRYHENVLAIHSLCRRSRHGNKNVNRTPNCRSYIYDHLEEFITTDARNGVAIRRERRTFMDFALGDLTSRGNKVVVLEGASGSGKTTILSTFADLYRNSVNNTTRLLIYHSRSASPSGHSLMLTLLRLGVELRRAFATQMGGFDLQPPSADLLNEKNTIGWWHKVVTEASEIGLKIHIHPVIFIDDAFVEEGIWSALLPPKFHGCTPPGVTIVMSTEYDNAVWRSIRVLSSVDKAVHFRNLRINELTAMEKHMVIEEKLASYDIEIPKSVSSEIADKNCSTSPLYLDGLCDEMVFSLATSRHCNLMDFVKGFVDTETREGLTDNEEEEEQRDVCFTDALLLRMEKTFGAKACAYVLTSLAVARFLDVDQMRFILREAGCALSDHQFRRMRIQLMSLCVVTPVSNMHTVHSPRTPSSTKTISVMDTNFDCCYSHVYHMTNSCATRIIVSRYTKGEMRLTSIEKVSDVLFKNALALSAQYSVQNLSEQFPMHIGRLLERVLHYATQSTNPHANIESFALNTNKLRDWLISMRWLNATFSLVSSLNQAATYCTNHEHIDTANSIREIANYIHENRWEIISDPNVMTRYVSSFSYDL